MKNKISALYAGLLLMASNIANAALPTTAAPTNAAAAGDYIGTAKGYTQDAILYAGLAICAFGFLIVAKNMIATYSEIGTGRKTWGDFGMQAMVGFVLLVVIVFIIAESSGVLF